MSPCLSVAFLVLAVVCGVSGTGLSEEEKLEILNAHNYYRSIVDPVATNMLKMVEILFIITNMLNLIFTVYLS